MIRCSSSPRTPTPTRRSGRPTSGSSTDRYVLWMGRGDEPGWNVAQRFRLGADEVDEVRAEIHARLRRRAAPRAPGRSARMRRPADLVERLLALGLVDDEPTPLAVGMVLTEPPARRRRPDVEVRRRDDAGGAARRGADRRGRVRDARADRAAAEPTTTPTTSSTSRTSTASRSRGRRPRSAEHGVDALRRRDAAGGARARRLPRARRGALGGRGRARDAGARHAGEPMSRPILARLGFREVCEIRILLDEFEPAERREGLGEGRLRDPGGGRAGRGGRRAGEGRADRAGAGDPAQVPREHPRRPPERRARRAASAGRRAATGSRGRPTRSASPT